MKNIDKCCFKPLFLFNAQYLLDKMVCRKINDEKIYKNLSNLSIFLPQNHTAA